ncbi:MAG TPA: VCBS repeat-containing protein, partial [Gemmataceae bacterium]|nr:VCBS repeat-containing protein [Gemmataceae bacterium]
VETPTPVNTNGVFDPLTGMWYLKDSVGPGAPDITPFAYGAPGWISVLGDWNGDGVLTIGGVDPATMTWYLKNSNTPGAPDLTPFAYGAPGWLPVVGDWDGDGMTTIGVVDPTTNIWYLKNSNSPGAPDIEPFAYGAPGWLPVVGDWDGDGVMTIGVFDPQTATWYLKNSNSPGAPNIEPFAYGGREWTPAVGDWNGDGTTTIGVLDPATKTWYLRNSNTPGAPDIEPFAYGGPTTLPAVGGKALPGAALRAAHSVATSGSLVSQTEVDAIAAAALERLQQSGLSPEADARLSSVRFAVGPLPGSLLGLAQLKSDAVLIDEDAAGRGWFVDSTPLDDAEFVGGKAVAGLAQERPDLLTAVLHKLGHVAGASDVRGDASADNLMQAILPDGVRRTQALDAVFARAASSKG